MRQMILLFMACCATWAGFAGASNTDNSGSAVVLTVDGPIGPATADYLSRGIEAAAGEGRALVVIRMDTPGGLDTAMRDIIKAILASPVPVATWVAPEGARAASAGTYILYASHIAAMAPATNLGAATPVSIGGSSPVSRDEQDNNKESDDDAAEDPGATEEKQPDSTAMERKVVNDAVAYIRGLAEKRGRNADWAERAVREAVSLPAEEALKQDVIDVMAPTLPALLAAIDGRTVTTSGGETTIDTSGLAIEYSEPDWRTEFLSIITDPTVAYLLLLVGIYGLIFEGYNPGAVLPGVVGAICLLLALYAFQVLPVNYAGLALIALGVILMAAEAFAPSFGALGIGGVIAFIVGSVILMDTDIPGFGIPVPVIAVISGAGALVVLAIVWFAVSSKRTRIVSGREEMIGLAGTALKDFEGRGAVFVHGERWFAYSRTPVTKGQEVRVTDIKGLVLHVTPLENTSPTHSKEQAS
ncbi:MAG TPA: nodulation protein NfeD [Gammaproteobacteria bacterium]